MDCVIPMRDPEPVLLLSHHFLWWVALSLMGDSWSADILCAVSIYTEEILSWIIYLHAPFIMKAGFRFEIKCKATSYISWWLQIPTKKGLWKYRIRPRQNLNEVCPSPFLWVIFHPLLRLSTKRSQHLNPQQDVKWCLGFVLGLCTSMNFYQWGEGLLCPCWKVHSQPSR